MIAAFNLASWKKDQVGQSVNAGIRWAALLWNAHVR
jgi:hypothetical protein